MDIFIVDEFRSKSGQKYTEVFNHGKSNNPYLFTGEICTRFLRINPSDNNSIGEFLYFCGFSTHYDFCQIDENINEQIYIEQKEVIQFITKYQEIRKTYSVETYFNNSLKTKFKAPSIQELASALSHKINDVIPSAKSFPISFPDAINKINQDKQTDRIDNRHSYKIYPQYEFQDPLKAVWVEIFCLLSKISNIKLIQCPTCKTYFVKSGNRKICFFCKIPPSLDRSSPLVRVKDKIRQRKKRGSLTLEYINKLKLEYKDSPEIIEYLKKHTPTLPLSK